MDLQNHKIMRLGKLSEILNTPKEKRERLIFEELYDYTGTKMSQGSSVILIDSSIGAFNIYRDLIRFANGGLRQNVKGRKGVLAESEEPNTIDDSAKQFLMGWTHFNEWLLNCNSLREGDFQNIEEFDRVELKARLEKLIATL